MTIITYGGGFPFFYGGREKDHYSGRVELLKPDAGVCAKVKTVCNEAPAWIDEGHFGGDAVRPIISSSHPAPQSTYYHSSTPFPMPSPPYGSIAPDLFLFLHLGLLSPFS